MSKYIVKVVNIFSNLVEVEAENEDKAREEAQRVVENATADQAFKHYYEATIPMEHWSVIEKEEFEKIKANVEAELATPKEPNNIVEPQIIVP